MWRKKNASISFFFRLGLFLTNTTIAKCFTPAGPFLTRNGHLSTIHPTLLSSSFEEDQEDNAIVVQRTLFKLDPKISSSMERKILRSHFQIEEHVYFRNDPIEEDFVDTGLKRYILRGPPNNATPAPSSDESNIDSKQRQRRRMTRVGVPLFSIEINELLSNDESAPGTGSSIWESSIALCIFLSSHPNLLQKNVLELGSGVGLAGILSCMCVGAVNQTNKDDTDGTDDDANKSEITSLFPESIESIIFTDYSEEVLDICNINAQKHIPEGKYVVKQLDWYKNNISSSKDANQYTTILGTDCAYLFPDVKPLAYTIASNLATMKECGKAFMLGPYNREAMHYLQTQLEESYQMDLDVGIISMDAFQLETVWLKNIGEKRDILMKAQDESHIYLNEFTSKKNTKYLMLEATHNKDFLVGKYSKN